jgi:hypothetical protein
MADENSGSSKAESTKILLAGPIKGPGFPHFEDPPDLQHRVLVFASSLFFLPTHYNRLDPLPVALPTGEAGRSSARQPVSPGPGRELA